MLNVIDGYSRECLAVRVGRKLNAIDVVDLLSDLFILRGVPGHVRSDDGPEFIAKAVPAWIAAVGATTAYIEPGSPWENGYRESFNARLRDELLDGENLCGRVTAWLPRVRALPPALPRRRPMQDHHSSTGTEPARPETLFVALDLSRSSWVAAIHAPHRDKIGRHKLAPGAEGVLALVGRVREQAERALGTPVRVVSCYEAGRDGFWLHRVLRKAGIENQVVDPTSLLVDRRARRVKTDRLDAEALLRALMAWSRGEPRVCAMVRVPSVEEEDARRTTRERANLLKERIRHVNRIKGLLATQGVYDFEPLRRDRLERLEALVTGDGRALPERLAAEARRHSRRLVLVLEMLAEVEAERDRALAEASGKEAVLLRLKGLGAEGAAALCAEIFHRTFANRRGVAAYAGLTPSPFASGGTCRDQGVSKAGNPRVRRMMVELAWLWVRFQPESELSRWFTNRVGTFKGRIRRIAIVALARKLLVALWRYVETGLLPTGAVLKT